MYAKKTSPDSIDTKYLYLLGRGYTTAEISIITGVAARALRSRVTRLYPITRTRTQCQLLYWMLSEDKFSYPPEYRRRKCPLEKRQLEVVQALAEGQFREEIRKKMTHTEGFIVSDSRYEKWMKEARTKVRAKSMPHLLAICYTEDWIV